MHPAQLYEVLKRIPFLKLGYVDYVDDVIKEVNDYKDQAKFLPFVQERIGKHFGYDGFMGSYLSPIYENEFYEFGNSSEINIQNIVPNSTTSWANFTVQQLGKDCPTVRKVVDDVLDTPASCRLTKLPAGEDIAWHWHYYIESVPNCREIVLHVPLITHQDVVAKVKLHNSDGEEKTFTQHFGKGELWYLNAYHWHIFENNSPIDRYHIWMNSYLTAPNGDPMNPRLCALFEQAIKTYKGPFIGKRTKDELAITVYN